MPFNLFPCSRQHLIKWFQWQWYPSINCCVLNYHTYRILSQYPSINCCVLNYHTYRILSKYPSINCCVLNYHTYRILSKYPSINCCVLNYHTYRILYPSYSLLFGLGCFFPQYYFYTNIHWKQLAQLCIVNTGPFVCI